MGCGFAQLTTGTVWLMMRSAVAMLVSSDEVPGKSAATLLGYAPAFNPASGTSTSVAIPLPSVVAAPIRAPFKEKMTDAPLVGPDADDRVACIDVVLPKTPDTAASINV